MRPLDEAYVWDANVGQWLRGLILDVSEDIARIQVQSKYGVEELYRPIDDLRPVEQEGQEGKAPWIQSTQQNEPQALPIVPYKTIYFDPLKLYALMDGIRIKSEKTWAQLAEEMGVRPHSFTRMKAGRYPSPDYLMRYLYYIRISSINKVIRIQDDEQA